MSDFNTLRERLLALAQEATRGTDLFVIDVQVRGARGRTLVDVVADTDSGIGIDELARLSRELGFVFDTHEAIATAYDLNVLSPGLREPLQPRQYPRHVGRPLDVMLAPAAEGAEREKISGVLRSTSEHGIVLELTDGTERSINFSDIERARVKLPW